MMVLKDRMDISAVCQDNQTFSYYYIAHKKKFKKSFEGTCLSLGICDDLTGDASHVGHCSGDDGSGGEGTEKLGLSSQGSSIELSNKQQRVLRGNRTTLKGRQDRRTVSYDGRIDGESRRLERRHRNVGRRNRSGDGGRLGCGRLSDGDLRSGHL